MGFNVQAVSFTLLYCVSLGFCLFNLISADWVSGVVISVGLFRTCIKETNKCKYGKFFY